VGCFFFFLISKDVNIKNSLRGLKQLHRGRTTKRKGARHSMGCGVRGVTYGIRVIVQLEMGEACTSL
jgi:hypothetical protein